MKTFIRRVRIRNDGVLRLNIATNVISSEVDVVVILQPIPPPEMTDNGYPVDFFEQIDRIEADDLHD